MKVSYNGLWKLLIDHEMKKMDLVEELGIGNQYKYACKDEQRRTCFYADTGKNL